MWVTNWSHCCFSSTNFGLFPFAQRRVSQNLAGAEEGSDGVLAASFWGWIPHLCFSCTCWHTCVTYMKHMGTPMLFTVVWQVYGWDVVSRDDRHLLEGVTRDWCCLEPGQRHSSFLSLCTTQLRYMEMSHLHKVTTGCTCCFISCCA